MFLPILCLSFVDDPPLFEEFSKVAFRRSVHRLYGDGLHWILHKVGISLLPSTKIIIGFAQCPSSTTSLSQLCSIFFCCGS
jgi:hypothetical protein